MLVIDKYAYENKIAKKNPWIKIGIFVLGLVLAFQPKADIKLATIMIYAGITIFVTQISIRTYLKWFYVILPFLVLSILGIVLTVSYNEDTLITSFSVGSSFFGVSRQMLPKGLMLGLQSLTAIVDVFFLALTTPFQQIIKVLLQLHFPKIFVEQVILIYRFIFIFLDASAKIYHAQSMRLGYHDFRVSIESISILIKMLFMQVIIDFEYLQNSLEVKLFEGDFHIE
ncbi:cobalt ECF transporter T component CbiQ [Pediococcus claussenii]|uniref:Cobalt ABC transporter, permease protein CbiQ n=1 Tax=Pediococcus claussenii (strain ATCC BAA-344 / DSM 14800 / JCM 18046 / KCTC 3811 / LMG 21948 / P06) TaxID=701521 RepID=G8PEW5_PEDCP|nr:cobalt ECF transporter T component CbiQ [Pediococcus claussenii]AEV95644.1 cobalt ABC transporter, permease protein CbiQ [Pediococcus claussenii ATCC BAA-344]ANZ69164.1 cobalt ECF transporter T component CbiQ [Pediococcus claussenii]ANZ70981.1 cobalt ECF transporter T component CbiQ [Pediococcus claussenii]KRN20123.1 cbiQ protein [Pediococcus claussenii]